MKNKTTKKLGTFLLLMGGILFTQFLNAQSCQGNKVWACRYDECGIQECKCINANQVQNWTSTIPQCNNSPWQHCCHGGTFRLAQNESDLGTQSPLQVYPNPVSADQSGPATISFFLAQSQDVFLGIYDASGRLVSTIASDSFEQGAHEIAWSAGNLGKGVYFLQINSGEDRETLKLVVTN